jgi:hypothetical protein
MKRESKKTRAAQLRFQQRVAEFLVSVGAVRDEEHAAYLQEMLRTENRPENYGSLEFWQDNQHHQFTLATNIGELKIHVYDNWIACRFEDNQAGGLFSDQCSASSGKWNFHYDDESLNDEVTTAWFFREVQRLVAYKPTAEQVEQAKRLHQEAKARYRRMIDANRGRALLPK